MKVSDPGINVIKASQGREFAFGIKNFANVFTILRDKLYSDKLAAIIREYTANAVDAHVQAGIPSKAVLIVLPTALDPTLKIRDYGLGLSAEDVEETYVMYGESTKTNSDDVIGQLGLGSKSGFAYSNMFTVRSFYNGVVTTYNAFIDETGVGAMKVMGADETTETGVEIIIAIRKEDINAIQEKAQMLLGFHETPVEVRGLRRDKVDFTKATLTGSLNTGKPWYVLPSVTSFFSFPVAVMGGVPYPIDTNQLGSMGKSNVLCNKGLVMFFPIGILEISASREALEYKPKTVTALKAAFRDLDKAIDQAVQDKVASAKTFLQAHQFACEAYKAIGLANENYNVTWKGCSVTPLLFRTLTGKKHNYYNFHDDDICRSVRIRRKSVILDRTGEIAVMYYSNLTNPIFAFSSDPDLKNVTGRLRALHNQHSNGGYGSSRQIYFFTWADKAQKDLHYKHWHLDQFEWVDLTTVQPAVIQRSARVGPGSTFSAGKAKTYRSKCFKLASKVFTSTPSHKSDWWDIETVESNDPTLVGVPYVIVAQGLYISDPTAKSITNQPWNFFRSYLELVREGLITEKNVYGFRLAKGGDLPDVPAGMVPFEAWLDKHLVKIVADKEAQIYYKIPEAIRASKIGSLRGELSDQMIAKRVATLPANSPFRMLVESVQKADNLPDSVVRLTKELETRKVINPVTNHHLLTLGDMCGTRYPLMRYLGNYYGGMNPDRASALLHYIHLIDSSCGTTVVSQTT